MGKVEIRKPEMVKLEMKLISGRNGDRCSPPADVDGPRVPPQERHDRKLVGAQPRFRRRAHDVSAASALSPLSAATAAAAATTTASPLPMFVAAAPTTATTAAATK